MALNHVKDKHMHIYIDRGSFHVAFLFETSGFFSGLFLFETGVSKKMNHLQDEPRAYNK